MNRYFVTYRNRTEMRGGDGAVAWESQAPADGCCLMPDAKVPSLWTYSNSLAALRRVAARSTPAALQEVKVPSRFVRSVQVDEMTGAAWFLGSCKVESADRARRPALGRVAQVGAAAEEALVDGGRTRLSFPTDLKVDSGRRVAWIADAGNSRVLAVSLDTLEVVRVLCDESVLFPCAVALDLSSGDVYVRAFPPAAAGAATSESSSSAGNAGPEVLARWSKGGSMEVVATVRAAMSLNPAFMGGDPEFLALAEEWGDEIFPRSASMRFDSLRRRLWVLSASTRPAVHMLSVSETVSLQTLDLAQAMDSASAIDVDEGEGVARVVGTVGGSGVEVVVNGTCSRVVGSTRLPGVPTGVVVVQPHVGLMACYAEVVADDGSMAAESSSSESTTSANGGLVSGAMAARQLPTAGALRASTQTAGLHVWTSDRHGVNSVFVSGGVGGAGSADLSRAVRLPTFKWSSSPVTLSPAIAAVVGRGAELMVVSGGSGAVAMSARGPLGEVPTAMSTSDENDSVFLSAGLSTVAMLSPSRMVAGAGESSSISVVVSSETPVEFSWAATRSPDDIRLRGMDARWHDRSGRLWCSSQGGSVSAVDGVMTSASMSSAGLLEAVRDVSPLGDGATLVVSGSRTTFLLDTASLTKRAVRAYDGRLVAGTDVDGGRLAVATVDDGGGESVLTVLDSDMRRVVLERIWRGFAASALAMVGGKVVVAGETAGGWAAVEVDLASGASASRAFSGSSRVVSVVKSSVGQGCWAVRADGSVLSCLGGLSPVGVFSGPVTIAKRAAPRASDPVGAAQQAATPTAQTPSQTAARVFVGTAEGRNDRWDSGEVSTASREMVYGGGDNLVPGCRYWVHVVVKHGSAGWSPVQVSEFRVPLT